jgi:DNA-binding GntR family transcriptional regulator
VSELEAPAGRVPELAYLRVADDIAARIGSGELTAKTRLRAERELADQYGVAYGTIRRAMKELRARGLVVSIHGRGTFVVASITPGATAHVPP